MNVPISVERGTDALQYMDYKRHFTTIDILPQNFRFVKYFAMSLNFPFTGRNISKTCHSCTTLYATESIICSPPEFQNFLGSACHTLSSQGVA